MTNCSEAFGVENLSRLFLGAAAVGAWVDLDEFNRVSLDVVSVAMTQMAAVRLAAPLCSRCCSICAHFEFPRCSTLFW